MELTISAQQTMTSRQIADAVGSEHHNVMATIRRIIREGVISGNETPYIHEQNGQQYTEFNLNYRDTMVVASGYSTELRARIIDRWIEIEKSSRAAPQFQIPTTLSGALRLAAEQAEIIEHQAAQIEAAAPAVEFVGRYVESETGSMGFRQVCKLLKAKEPEFRAFLHDNQIMYKLGGEWVPYAAHIDAGRFEVKTGTANEHAYSQSKFTPKGVEWIAGEWAKHQIKEAV
jgi:phage antirepressor YoqD-like protein